MVVSVGPYEFQKPALFDMMGTIEGRKASPPVYNEI